MAEKKGFVRLNPKQKEVLELIQPLDGDVEFFSKVRSGALGIPYERLLPVLGELQDLGYVTILIQDGDPYCVSLASWAYCYRHEYLVNICLPAIVNGLAGVSGGLVVWMLTNLFG